ncbi:MAG: indolepyruvate ferredoxin oxidoreductase family protein, partial [Rubrivivax sp.]|nr:indolepyruvate ferredoxin oxidoreductase family protein [Rubrivivax sp.]
MNAPLPEAVRKALETASLDDKYTLAAGRAFMSGVQALVRLPMLQRQRDVLAGLNTAGFVSGYRGSPLGGYDQALWAAKKHLAEHHVVFQPGVNEELGATAVWGTQQLDLYPEKKKYDGVFGIWYGKGPGVDRCSDVFKHANMAGTARHGGVIAIAGDDHVAKSSTAPHQSDHIFKACGLPVFFPSGVQDILDMGLHAFAMSRFSGLWSGMKTIQEVVESSSSVIVDPARVKIVLPEDFRMPPGGLHIRWPDAPLEQEARLMDYKWYAALAYVRANRLNHNVIEGPNDRFGIIASGKAYNDTRQALADLGLDDDTCRALGIRLHKVNVVWPLEANITREFATGLREILVVEEKRQIIEYQLKEELYNWRPDVRPNVLGKFDEPEGDSTGGEWSMPNPSENWLLRAKADLTPAIIAKALTKRLKKLGVPDDVAARMDRRIAEIEARERQLVELKIDTGDRAPWFCSGCPHNTSTRVPEGSRAVAGIGCHYMAVWMDRSTSTFTQMGGEGVPWVGQAPFTNEAHIFANLGDGTYFHSGILAIRQSIAAGVNITYKLLYNDAVAMTGGQQVGERPEGHSVLQIMKSLVSEGVAKLSIVTDQPEKYQGVALEPGVAVHHRDELDAIQRQFREIKGTTVILYDQTCATEKRRRRKRGKLPDPQKRTVVNSLVCEGCGDCGEKSFCVSVLPKETEFGRKRDIDQSNCNKDFRCVDGFCPSFVTVHGGTLRKGKKANVAELLNNLPAPTFKSNLEQQPWNILITGVGGTGVVTIGALLGMAGHLEGKGASVLDQTGLAQKGGAVTTHIRIAKTPNDIHAVRIAAGEADLVLGCDMVVVNDYWALSKVRGERSHVVLNSYEAMPGTFTTHPDMQFPAAEIIAGVKVALGGREPDLIDATQIATALMGDAIATNLFLLGYAWQQGLVPISF